MTTEVRTQFSLASPPDRVWAALTDPAVVASCLPGGELTEIVDERSFRGAIDLSLGPFEVRFEGNARFEELDREAGRALLTGEAGETHGRAEGSMRMRSRVVPDGPGTVVEVRQSLELHGWLGRFVPARVLAEAARYVLRRFESALRNHLLDDRGDAGHVTPDA